MKELRIDKTKRTIETQNKKVELRIFIQILMKILIMLQKILEKAHLNQFPLKQFIEEENEKINQNRFYIQIGKGCLNNCSYCIIKKARGKIRSREIDEILDDINQNLKNEKNIFFVSDDCGSYGKDIGENLFKLVKVTNNYYPKKLIDLNYLNPRWVDSEQLNYLKMIKKYNINSINLTIQSGSKKILCLMNRKYNHLRSIEFVQKARIISPKTLIWTHYMVGFPGETWKDFFQTLSQIRLFDYGYVIKYSDREGTQSINFVKKVPESIKKIRYYIAYFFMISNFILRILKSSFQRD